MYLIADGRRMTGDGIYMLAIMVVYMVVLYGGRWWVDEEFGFHGRKATRLKFAA